MFLSILNLYEYFVYIKRKIKVFTHNKREDKVLPLKV